LNFWARAEIQKTLQPQASRKPDSTVNADAAGLQHLGKHPKHDAIILVLEPFLADFVSCLHVLEERFTLVHA
jgi:hypothetical protein